MFRRGLVALALASAVALPGAAYAKDSADFDGDGFADLAIGVPGETVSGKVDAGAVIVLYGGASGLTAAGAQQWSQDSAGIGGVSEAGDNFGSSLAWGDIDNDGFDDLVIGLPDEDYEKINDGIILVIYGSAAGLTSGGNQVLGQSDTGVLGNEDDDRFGAAVAVGDFGNDGFDDVAVGAPNDEVVVADAGVVAVLDGSAAGLTGAGNQGFISASFGVAGTVTQRFGYALTTGDFNGDGRDDLAMGLPGADHNGSTDAGTVIVAYGTAGGVSTVGGQVIMENAGVGSDNFENLGECLAAGDFNNNGKADLAIGVPGQDVTNKNAAGEVLVYMGKATGLDLTKPKFWNQDSAPGGVAIKDKAETDDRFGEALSTGDFNGDGNDDLAVGVPFEDNKNEDTVTIDTNAGQVHIINGSGTGLTAVGNKKLHQGAPGVQGNNDPGDLLGTTLATGDFNNDGRSDIAIGIPGEDAGALEEGAILTMHGSATGLLKATSDWSDQDEIGFTGSGQDKMGFGVYGP